MISNDGKSYGFSVAQIIHKTVGSNMRAVIYIILFSFFLSCSKDKNNSTKLIKRTKIDSLSNLNEIRNFVKTVDSSLVDFICISPHTYLEKNSKLSQKLQKIESDIPYFVSLKEDFDQNGYSDLILTGEYYKGCFNVIAIMNFGSDKYSVVPLTNEYNNPIPVYPKLIYKNEIPIVELYTLPRAFQNVENDMYVQRLIYNYDRFLDYNEIQEEYKISQIEFNTTGCFGSCPVFDLEINKNSKSVFIAKYHNFNQKLKADLEKQEGTFETIIDKNDYKELCQILNFLQIKKFNDFYASGGTCQPSCTLKVYFDNGTVKTIEDYGKNGTVGLNFLYKKLSDLRFNQQWTKI